MAAGLGFKDFQTGEVLTAADVDGYLMQGIWVFADSTARDAAVTSPQEGNFAFLKDTNVTTFYDGAAWVNVDTTGMTNPMTTTADIIYSSSGSTPARLGIGTAGQVLQVNSGATAPEWATPASGGGMTLIQEQTASANSSISFTGIAGTYKQLLLMWSGIYHSGTGSTFAIRFNNDSTTQYRGNAISGLGSTVIARSINEVSVTAGGAVNLAPFGVSADLNTTDFNLAAVGTLLVDNYASTTKVKTFFTQFGYYDNSAAHYSSGQINGTFNTQTDITSVDIVRLTGAQTFTNITNSSIRLYGIS